MALCGIVEKKKPPCGEELQRLGRGRTLYCPVHCRAKTPRGPCKRHHYHDGLRCDLHGGKTPKGLASPHTQDGTHSRYLGVLSPAMREVFERRQKDLNKLSLEPEIDLLHSRAEMMIQRSREGESWASWEKAIKAFDEFADAQASQDRDAALEAIQRLGAILRRGVEAERDWERIDKLLYVRKPRMAEAEVKRAQVMAEIMHRSFVMQVLQVIAEGVKRRVRHLPEGKEIVAGVQKDIRRLGGGMGLGVGRGGDSPTLQLGRGGDGGDDGEE